MRKQPLQMGIWIQIGIWALLVLLMGGGAIWWAVQRFAPRPTTVHDGPPPNWGNPPLYPNAQDVPSCVSRGTILPLPRSDMYFGPRYCTRFAVPDPPQIVLDWYAQHFTAEGWVYTPESSVGLDLHKATKNFWKYNWYKRLSESGDATYSAYFMDIEAEATDSNTTTVTILLGDWSTLGR